jgi:hypothetical protein
MRELEDSDAWTTMSTRTSFQTGGESVFQIIFNGCEIERLALKGGAINVRHPHKIDRGSRKHDMRSTRRPFMSFNPIPEEGFFPVQTLRDYDLLADERLKDLKTTCNRLLQAGRSRFGCAVRSAICFKASISMISRVFDQK